MNGQGWGIMADSASSSIEHLGVGDTGDEVAAGLLSPLIFVDGDAFNASRLDRKQMWWRKICESFEG